MEEADEAVFFLIVLFFFFFFSVINFDKVPGNVHNICSTYVCFPLRFAEM